MPMQPRTFVSNRHIRQSMGRLKVEVLKYLHESVSLLSLWVKGGQYYKPVDFKYRDYGIIISRIGGLLSPIIYVNKDAPQTIFTLSF
jgi:hypothetical protein